MKKRLLDSIIGGVFIPWSLFLLGDLADRWIGFDQYEWLSAVTNISLGLIAWPLVIVAPFMPGSNSHSPYASSIQIILLVAAILMDVLVYSALTYLFLRWRARLKSTSRVAELGGV
jgi:hypothetical protein